MFPLLLLVGLGALLYRWRAASAASASPLVTGSLAMQVNATLHGGTPAQKSAVLAQYQTSKGISPADGVYSAAVAAALVSDGIVSPPTPPDSDD